ncbi:hypothetical protein [Ottowia testudinis]|uniref:Uncharacterized protein n=1 Tax=Ottowia testudinis TaxID=2816950 RepID=A0A975CN09_9BURK|nr:hypothetical protein [Ottowia testudinis]QTD47189.1 hypothetical protein J1M35_10140 [Ottowia testudinis]
MKNMQRALRRQHVARLKAARRFHWGHDLRHDAASLGKAVNTPRPCSCWMCGNPRRHFGSRTPQELASQLQLAEGAYTRFLDFVKAKQLDLRTVIGTADLSVF